MARKSVAFDRPIRVDGEFIGNRWTQRSRRGRTRSGGIALSENIEAVAVAADIHTTGRQRVPVAEADAIKRRRVINLLSMGPPASPAALGAAILAGASKIRTTWPTVHPDLPNQSSS